MAAGMMIWEAREEAGRAVVEVTGEGEEEDSEADGDCDMSSSLEAVSDTLVCLGSAIWRPGSGVGGKISKAGCCTLSNLKCMSSEHISVLCARTIDAFFCHLCYDVLSLFTSGLNDFDFVLQLEHGHMECSR